MNQLFAHLLFYSMNFIYSGIEGTAFIYFRTFALEVVSKGTTSNKY